MPKNKTQCAFIKTDSSQCCLTTYREFCYQHRTGQKFIKCKKEGCNRYTNSKIGYCACSSTGIMICEQQRRAKHLQKYYDTYENEIGKLMAKLFWQH